jgi:hypothetical protein
MYNFFNKYTYQILDRYQVHIVLEDTIQIGFTGAAFEKPPPVFTNDVSEDVLFFAASIDFLNPAVLVRIRSISPQYEWMANNDPQQPQDTPVNAIAGYTSQVMPQIPLPAPFFLKAQGRLQLNFTNSGPAAPGVPAPIIGGLWTWHALRLTGPINGGWDYAIGFVP